MQRGSRASFANERGAIDEALRLRVESREAKHQARQVPQRVFLEADDAPLAAQQLDAAGERYFESKDDALRPRLGSDERDARSREGLELVLEELFGRSVRPRHANRDGLLPGFVGHEARAYLPFAPLARYMLVMSGQGRKALVVGGGAREHALVRALQRSGAEVLAAPGNPGIGAIAKLASVAADDIEGMVALALAERVDLVVIGPERPLTVGLADALRDVGIATFGPGRAGAALEGSKAVMKEFLARHRIPTAAFRVFDDAIEALAYVRRDARALVVKADGLAAGKGVVVARDADEAAEAVEAMMVRRVFGDAGAKVVIEALLPGEEASFHLVCAIDASTSSSMNPNVDHERGMTTRAHAMAPAQDHKRVFDDDRGPNTGGMGAYAPAPVVTAEVHAKVMDRIVGPTLRGLVAEGIDYRGVLFIGLMIHEGEPSVLEFNVRFGDPEATVILPLEHDVWALLDGAARGRLPVSRESRPIALPAHSPRAALSVVLAAERYPETPATGDRIEGIEQTTKAFVHHAGTRRADDGTLVTSGGRVLAVTGEGATLAEARAHAYEGVSQVRFRGMHFRSDIGFRALGRVD